MIEFINNFWGGFILGWITALPILKWLFGSENVIPRLHNWLSWNKYYSNKKNCLLEDLKQGEKIEIRNTGLRPVKIIDIVFSDRGYLLPYGRMPSDKIENYVKGLRDNLNGKFLDPQQSIEIAYIKSDFYFAIKYGDLDGKYADSISWMTDMY